MEEGAAEVVTPASPSLPIRILKDIGCFKTSVVIIFAPLIFSFLLFDPTIRSALGESESTCTYCVVVMALYWMFEVMPLAVTALLPLALFPVLGVIPARDISNAYLPDINFLFIGGLTVAVAVEKCNLHTRIALRVLTLVGSQPRWIMLGFMSVTAFLSMWISNTATTAMLEPIARSVIIQLARSRKLEEEEEAQLAQAEQGGKGDEKDEMHMSLMRHEVEQEKEIRRKSVERKPRVRRESVVEEIDLDTMTPYDRGVAKGLLISVAFAANIGGCGTITGTPPNLVMMGQLKSLFDKADSPVKFESPLNFASWMMFAVPLVIVSVVLCWVSLVFVFLGWRGIICRCKKRESKKDAVADMMKSKYANLPPVSYAEWSVLACFGILLSLWIFRDPGFPGFGSLFKPRYYTDATSAMIIAIILFALPSERPDFIFFKSRDRTKDPVSRAPLMDWKAMQLKFPWSVVLLLGGGFALARGVKESGLSALVGSVLSRFGGLPLPAIQLLCVIMTMFITNICSNTVTASIFVPIVAALAVSINIHPLALMLPTTLACSYAFSLPVATPPNAIVFASGLLTVGDMMKSGLLITVLSAGVIVVYMQTYVHLVLNLGVMPEWSENILQGAAQSSNATFI